MRKAAANLDFEEAAPFRDDIRAAPRVGPRSVHCPDWGADAC